jgi:hypothetical protein
LDIRIVIAGRFTEIPNRWLGLRSQYQRLRRSNVSHYWGRIGYRRSIVGRLGVAIVTSTNPIAAPTTVAATITITTTPTWSIGRWAPTPTVATSITATITTAYTDIPSYIASIGCQRTQAEEACQSNPQSDMFFIEFHHRPL